jgi:competence protein ComEC
VGHGLAAHVQTARHDLIFDTGPAYGAGSDAGERVILPYLAAQGVERLDRLVVSHDDIDHSGGAGSLLGGIAVARWSSSLLPSHPLRRRPAPHDACAAGQAWAWDGVRFEFLHPPPDLPAAAKDNDHSCVLRLQGRSQTALLSADIEARREAWLLQHAAGKLASDVLVVPHHGSRSSSSPAFVRAVDPGFVLYPVGYLNRFRHPHATVEARWAASGAQEFRTDRDGSISVDSGDGLSVRTRRGMAPRYWHGR